MPGPMKVGEAYRLEAELHQGGHAGAPRHGRHGTSSPASGDRPASAPPPPRRGGLADEPLLTMTAAGGRRGALRASPRTAALASPWSCGPTAGCPRPRAAPPYPPCPPRGEAGWRLGGCSTRRGGLISPRFELGGNSAGPTAAAAAATAAAAAAVAAAAVAGGGRWSDAPEDAQNEDEPHTSVSMKLLHNV